MRYPSEEQRDGARSQKAGDFGLTLRALKFARFYAEQPRCTISYAARAAGFSDRARGAHVRGCELLRDPRVVRAILHFSALAVAKARGPVRGAAGASRPFAARSIVLQPPDGCGRIRIDAGRIHASGMLILRVAFEATCQKGRDHQQKNTAGGPAPGPLSRLAHVYPGYFEKSCIASAASRPPVIEMGAKGVFDAI